MAVPLHRGPRLDRRAHSTAAVALPHRPAPSHRVALPSSPLPVTRYQTHTQAVFNRIPIVAEGTLEPLISYIKDEDSDLIGRQYCAMCLGNLAAEPENHEEMVKLECIDALMTVGRGVVGAWRAGTTPPTSSASSSTDTSTDPDNGPIIAINNTNATNTTNTTPPTPSFSKRKMLSQAATPPSRCPI